MPVERVDIFISGGGIAGLVAAAAFGHAGFSVLLEPIASVTISIPSEYTGQAQSVVSKRRGQILGFDSKAGWKGWDEVKANMPQSELHDLIVDLRSLTLGVGTFEWQFDHLAELTGRDADIIVEQRQKAEE